MEFIYIVHFDLMGEDKVYLIIEIREPLFFVLLGNNTYDISPQHKSE
jgi:hypothetical protein